MKPVTFSTMAPPIRVFFDPISNALTNSGSKVAFGQMPTAGEQAGFRPPAL